jgi:hypothetical protein
MCGPVFQFLHGVIFSIKTWLPRTIYRMAAGRMYTFLINAEFSITTTAWQRSWCRATAPFGRGRCKHPSIPMNGISMTREDCRHIVLETFVPIGHLPSICHTSAGSISGEKGKEVVDLYQHDVVMIAGGGLLHERPDLTFTYPTLMKQVEQP